MKKLSLILVPVCALAATPLLAQTNPIAIFPEEDAQTAENLLLVWPATPGIRYEVRQTTNLQSWATAPGFPAAAPGPAQAMPFATIGTARFFQVRELDEQPPAMASQYPQDGGFAVPRFANLTIQLSDVTGVDTNSIRLTVGSLGTFALTNAQLTFSNGLLTYLNGGSIPLGGWGSNVTATLIAADTLGNRGTNTWRFTLELQPQVVTNLFVFGSPQAQRTGQRIGNIPTASLAARFGPVPMNDGDPWTLELVETNRLEISYTNTAPGFAIDQYLCNLTPATTNEIFYRKVTAISDSPGTKLLTLFTTNVPLAEILEEGSAALSTDSMIYTLGTNNVIIPAFSFEDEIVFDSIGIATNDMVFRDTNGITLTLKEAKFLFTPSLELSFETKFLSLQRFNATLRGQLETALVPELHIEGSTSDDFDFDLYHHKLLVYVGQAGPVPIWLDFDFSVKAYVGYTLAADATMTTGVRKDVELSFGVDYMKDRSPPLRGDPKVTPQPTQTVPFTYEINGSASAYATLIPQLDVRVNSLAGLYANVDPRLEVEGSASFSNGQITSANLCLTADADLNVGLSILGFGNALELASFKLFEKDWCTDYPPPVTLTIIAHPQPQQAVVGSSATFTVNASGPALTYQWYDNNGTLMLGKTGPSLTLYNVALGHQGPYRVKVTGGGQTLWSNPAALTVYTASTPSGMALIPAGSFTMGNCMATNEGDNDELPLHTVYVSAFYLDRYEVTKALWDEVKAWNGGNGYSFDFVDSGQGKAVNHPSHTMTWYDSVKWCNARSQKDNLTPCYYTDAGLTTIYKTGQLAPYVKWTANGYRLPTEAEWEKAARGGASGHRFPWSDTENITHSRANYFSFGDRAYDTSSTRGNHPTFKTNGIPCTSPVGYFTGNANGFGLYDMAGNVYEWCWDWYGDYSSDSQTDPRGPSSGQYGAYRVRRGGNWFDGAFLIRVALRLGGGPTGRGNGVGFRCARAAGQ